MLFIKIFEFIVSFFKTNNKKTIDFENDQKKEIREEYFIISDEIIFQMFPDANNSDLAFYIKSLKKYLPIYGINNKKRIAHFMAQIAHESGNFKYREENLNYSSIALIKVFGKYFSSIKEADKFAYDPVRIANRVYSNRIGNGDESSGDGYRYRGRGLIQLTGKFNYITCGSSIGVDLVGDPDKARSDADTMVQVACWFWKSRELNKLADIDDINSITRKINGGLNGIEHRKKLLKNAKDVLGEVINEKKRNEEHGN